MAKATLEVTVRLAWWFKPYVFCLFWTAWLSGREPDWDKMRAAVNRAYRVTYRAKRT
jgi:hypothetical protein